jgi:hypothetical protein
MNDQFLTDVEKIFDKYIHERFITGRFANPTCYVREVEDLLVTEKCIAADINDCPWG